MGRDADLHQANIYVDSVLGEERRHVPRQPGDTLELFAEDHEAARRFPDHFVLAPGRHGQRRCRVRTYSDTPNGKFRRLPSPSFVWTSPVPGQLGIPRGRLHSYPLRETPISVRVRYASLARGGTETALARATPELEDGGLLFGVESRRLVEVLCAIPAGPNAQRMPNSFSYTGDDVYQTESNSEHLRASDPAGTGFIADQRSRDH
jgi:hypothetical protein